VTTPTCEYFGWCGGCTSQDPETFGYRNRMDFTIFFGGIGLRRKQRYDFVEKIKQCPIALPPINTLLQELWIWFEQNKPQLEPFLIKKLVGTLRYAIVRCTAFSDDTAIVFVVNGDSPRAPEQIELLKAFAEKSSAKHILIGRVTAQAGNGVPETAEVITGTGILTEYFLGQPVQYHALGFAQANPHGFQKLLEYIQNLIRPYAEKYPRLIDLYGGAGTFGFSLSPLFQKVTIIDTESLNIRCAEKNVRENNYPNVMINCADAATVVELPDANNSCLILDPPRAGIHPKTLKKIIELKAPVILYVSCKPKQFDLERPAFLAKYELKSFRKFDLFPNTAHYETVAELTLKK
jgi:tRNA/tmRNA/rRNA uracil-C5-methylase (TrmA/RlmC/RlmD family)